MTINPFEDRSTHRNEQHLDDMSFFRPDAGTATATGSTADNNHKKKKKWSKKGNIPRTSSNPLANPPTIHSYHSSPGAAGNSNYYSSSNNNNGNQYRGPTIAPIGLPESVFRLRAINMGLAATAFVFGLLSIGTCLLTLHLKKLLLSAYLTFFAGVLTCYETHSKLLSGMMKDNFGFLYDCKLRTVYIFMMSTVCFQVGGIGYLLGLGMFVDGFFHLLIIRRYGDMDVEQQQRSVESEDLAAVLASKVTSFGYPQPEWTTLHSGGMDHTHNKASASSEMDGLLSSQNGYTVIQ